MRINLLTDSIHGHAYKAAIWFEVLSELLMREVPHRDEHLPFPDFLGLVVKHL
jgi:hypothetical protein